MSRCSSTRSPSRSSCRARSAANEVSGCGPEAPSTRLLGDPAQQDPAEPVVLQQPVPVRAEHGAGVGTLGPDEPGGSPDRHHPAVVDLVAAHRLAPARCRSACRAACRRRTRRRGPAGRARRRCADREVGLHARAGRGCGARASGSRRRSRAPDVRRAACATTASARPVRRSQARSLTVDFDPGSTTRSTSSSRDGLGHVPDGDARLAGQRLGVGGVGDPRQPDDGDPQPLRPVRRGRAAQHPVGHGGQRVLGVEPQPVRPRQRRRTSDGRSARAAGRAPARAATGRRGTC